MLTIVPSSGPSDTPARARIGGVGSRTRCFGIDRETGARALAIRVGNPCERLLQAVARGPLRQGGFERLCSDPGWSDRLPESRLPTLVSTVLNLP